MGLLKKTVSIAALLFSLYGGHAVAKPSSVTNATGAFKQVEQQTGRTITVWDTLPQKIAEQIDDSDETKELAARAENGLPSKLWEQYSSLLQKTRWTYAHLLHNNKQDYDLIGFRFVDENNNGRFDYPAEKTIVRIYGNKFLGEKNAPFIDIRELLKTHSEFLDYRLFVSRPAPQPAKILDKTVVYEQPFHYPSSSQINYSDHNTARSILEPYVTMIVEGLQNKKDWLPHLVLDEFTTFFGSLENPHIPAPLQFEIVQHCNNSHWYTYLFWDENSNGIHDQTETIVLNPIQPGQGGIRPEIVIDQPVATPRFRSDTCDDVVAGAEVGITKRQSTVPTQTAGQSTYTLGGGLSLLGLPQTEVSGVYEIGVHLTGEKRFPSFFDFFVAVDATGTYRSDRQNWNDAAVKNLNAARDIVISLERNAAGGYLASLEGRLSAGVDLGVLRLYVLGGFEQLYFASETSQEKIEGSFPTVSYGAGVQILKNINLRYLRLQGLQPTIPLVVTQNADRWTVQLPGMKGHLFEGEFSAPLFGPVDLNLYARVSSSGPIDLFGRGSASQTYARSDLGADVSVYWKHLRWGIRGTRSDVTLEPFLSSGQNFAGLFVGINSYYQRKREL